MTRPALAIFLAIVLMAATGGTYASNIARKESELHLMPPDTAKANLLISLGKHYCSRNSELALLYLQQALVISTELNYKQGIAGSYLYQGRSYYYKDQYGIAFEYLDKARRLYDELQDDDGLAEYHFASGAINAIIGNFLNAIQDFHAIITLTGATENTRLKSLGYQSLGALHIRRDEPDLAMHYLNNALLLAIGNDDTQLVSNAMTNIGLAYEAAGKPDSAMYFMKKGLEIRTQLQEKRGIASSGLIIGRLLVNMERYPEAIDILRSSESAYAALNDDTGISIAMMHLAEAFAYSGEYEEAEKMSGYALALAKRIGNPSLTGDVYAVLAAVYAHAGNFKQAYNHTLLLNHLRDSLAEANKERIVSELEMRFQTARKDDRIMLLEARSEVQRKNNILLSVSMAALIVIVVLMIILYRLKNRGLRRHRMLLQQEKTIRCQEAKLQHKEQQLLKEQLEAKNRELASKALEMLRINETINSIIGQLNEHSRSNNESDQLNHHIGRIISGLESQLKNNSWREFEKIYNNIHSGFFSKLLEVCPDLTPSEIKIAALLKLNLNTKEMAALTYKSEAGIKSTRYRLRKKLQLNSDDSLIPYLMQL